MTQLNPIKDSAANNIGKEDPTNKEVKKVDSTLLEVEDKDLDKEYLDTRYVTISLVQNYSAYRKANITVLGNIKGRIGSSIYSCRTLSANKGEVEAYFPSLIGYSPNNPEFVTRVQAWLSNIDVLVDDSDKRLNISFRYNKKSDYLAIKKQEDKINAEYDKVDRTNISAIKEAVKVKVAALNKLESTKYKYGSPENIEEYLIYRHCLLYKEVAKDMALINSDSTLRFYIKDEAKEAAKKNKLVKERLKAMQKFIELKASDNKFNSVFAVISAANSRNLIEELNKTDLEKTAIVMDFINNNPIKFNKLVEDKNITIKALIETLITHGELVRSEYNQQISTADGTFIGSNVKEAVAWFNNPDNKDFVTAMENKIKLIK